MAGIVVGLAAQRSIATLLAGLQISLVPVDLLRRELARFVATRPEWDGRVVGLQVTNATDRAVELRALVSAADAGRAWDLRCAVREHLLTFLQRLDGGRHLPRVRLEAQGRPEGRNVVAGSAPATGDAARGA